MTKVNIIYLLVLLTAFQSCIGDGMTKNQRSYIDSLKPIKPSVKEKLYIEKLKNQGFSNIILEIPHIGEIGKGLSSYKVIMNCPFGLNENNKDSIIELNKVIAFELFESVLDDSIIDDFGSLVITFKMKDSQIDKWNKIIVRKYNKSDLEDSLGFEVIKVDERKFKRIIKPRK